MDPLQLYLIFQADYIQGMFTFFCIAGAVISVISFITKVLRYYDGDAPHVLVNRVPKWSVPFFVVGLMGWVLIPNTNNMIAIYGIHHVTQVASENEQVQELPDNFLNFLNTYLENEIKEMEQYNK